MMKFFLLPLFLFGLVLSAASAYALSSGDGNLSADHGARSAPVTLGVGDKFELPDGSLLQSVELIQDSRCPADAFCVWQGEALLQFELDGLSFRRTFTGPDDAVTVVDGWAIQVLDVQPYPLASVPHDPADAEVTLRVYSVE